MSARPLDPLPMPPTRWALCRSLDHQPPRLALPPLLVAPSMPKVLSRAVRIARRGAKAPKCGIYSPLCMTDCARLPVPQQNMHPNVNGLDVTAMPSSTPSPATQPPLRVDNTSPVTSEGVPEHYALLPVAASAKPRQLRRHIGSGCSFHLPTSPNALSQLLLPLTSLCIGGDVDLPQHDQRSLSDTTRGLIASAPASGHQSAELRSSPHSFSSSSLPESLAGLSLDVSSVAIGGDASIAALSLLSRRRCARLSEEDTPVAPPRPPLIRLPLNCSASWLDSVSKPILRAAA